MDARMYDVEKTLRLQNARLAALHHLSMKLTSTLDLGDILERIVEMAQVLSESAHAHIFLYDSAHDELVLAASHWASEERIIPLKPRRGGITHEVACSGRAEYIEDTRRHPAYAALPPADQPGALACLPLIHSTRILGTLNLGYWEPHPYDDQTRQFLDLMAQQAALAIHTARLHADGLKRARLERELQVAREFQASLIPEQMPCVTGWDFAALWRPAHTVSGDFYDFLNIEGESLQGMAIADISDKGMPAALFTSLARSTIRASITAACCPADWMTHANRVLSKDTVNGMFVTLCYAQVLPGYPEMVYVNAGHNPPWLFHRADQSLTPLTRTGIALGVDEDRRCEQRSVMLAPGDFVLFYTDGVLEAANERGEEFGMERLKRCIFEGQGASAADLVAGLDRALSLFIGDIPQFDDMTVLVAKRAPAAPIKD